LKKQIMGETDKSAIDAYKQTEEEITEISNSNQESCDDLE